MAADLAICCGSQRKARSSPRERSTGARQGPERDAAIRFCATGRTGRSRPVAGAGAVHQGPAVRDLVVPDEIQPLPEFFVRLHAGIDRDRRPGRLLLLKSASGPLLRQGHENLTGRSGGCAASARRVCWPTTTPASTGAKMSSGCHPHVPGLRHHRPGVRAVAAMDGAAGTVAGPPPGAGPPWEPAGGSAGTEQRPVPEAAGSAAAHLDAAALDAHGGRPAGHVRVGESRPVSMGRRRPTPLRWF